MSNIRRALDAHGTISGELRASTAPIVRAATPRRLLHGLCGSDLLTLPPAAQAHPGGEWTPAGDVAATTLEHAAAEARSAGLSLRALVPSAILDHASLQRVIRSGALHELSLRRTTSVTKALELGRAVRGEAPTLRHEVWPLASISAAAAAADDCLMRRAAPSVLLVVPEFRVPDAYRPDQLTHILDQLWVVREESAADVRLLGLTFDAGRPPASRSRRDEALAIKGYESFHAAEYWCRIDPQRVIREFLRAAAVPLAEAADVPVPGPAVNDYWCASCRQSMIRTPDGHGIVAHRSLFVHEECYQEALENDVFAGMPEDEETFSVLNFR